MRIHLVTVVGADLDILPFMLAHYRALGIESFVINVHIRQAEDPALTAAREAVASYGCGLASVTLGEWQTVMHGLWEGSMRVRSNDWCVLADQDELQMYPDDLSSLLAYCDRKGYDYITGALLDRLSVDGSLPVVDHTTSIEDQFPLGAFVSLPMLGADPRKVVAAKGWVPVGTGQHEAFAGVACPIEEAFVPVHHFKWTAGLVDRLRDRSRTFRRQNVSHWIESERFVSYFETHQGRIDLSDRRFLVSPSRPAYQHWPLIAEMAMAHRSVQIGRKTPARGGRAEQ